MRRPDLAIPLGVLLLVDVVRVWLPSVITVFGQAGSTPAELLGAFALSWFLLGFGVPVLVRAFGGRGPARVGLTAALALAGCRLALVGTAGEALLYVACAGLLAGIVWLVTLALRGARLVEFADGLALAAVQHAALGTQEPTWRGLWGALVVAATAVAFVWFAARGHLPAGGGAGGWFVVGPVLFLALQIGLSPALVQVGLSDVAGWPGAAGAVVVTVAAVALFLVAAWRPPRPGWARVASVVLLVLGAVGFGYGPRWLLVVVVPVTAAALGACFGLAAGSAGSAGSASPAPAARRGYATAAGLLVFAVAAFAYYAAYDLGYPNGWVPVVVAAVVGGVALARTADPERRPLPPFAVGAVAVLVVLVGAGAWWSPPETRARPGDAGRPGGADLRVLAYNVRMGFGLDGRFSVAEISRVIRAERPDVVLLSEVDRGWLLNGGHDDLTLIARAVGMRYLFGPAADAVWGDAILTNLPVVSVRTRRLPRHGAPIGAQALGAVLRHGAGEVAVVSTHLQPPPEREPVEQARELARFAAELRAPGRPVIVGGDLNTEPGAPGFVALQAAGLIDVLAPSRPLPTSPADAPRAQIDHLFILDGPGGPGGPARDVATPRSTASDHLPVAATFDLSTGRV